MSRCGPVVQMTVSLVEIFSSLLSGVAGQGVSVRDSVPGHVTKLSRYIRPQKTLRLGTVKASTILSGNVLVVCFEFRALMVACGGRHIEKSTILQWRV